jgi:hypothetical protein
MKARNTFIIIILLLVLSGCGFCTERWGLGLTYDTEVCHIIRGEPLPPGGGSDSTTIRVKDSGGQTIRTYQINDYGTGNIDVRVHDNRRSK